ncbi:MAG TPA: FAD-dependent oxidoreductase [Streptosporangiaceae bacterium]|nr:FAD-dependent oxidoreductase [Streptosporangiaceae bacterium]
MRLIVVGAGIVGAACAYAASGLGAEVVLVDAGLPGQATAAGAGIICPWSARADDPAWYAFACTAARQYPELVAGLADDGEQDVSYRRVGALIIARDGEEAAREGERMRARQAATPEIGEVDVLTAAEAQALFPPLRPGSAAAYLGGAARVDGRQLTGALVRAACRRGAVTRPGRAALACRAGRVAGVEIDGQLAGADAVVAATGAWTTSFLAPAVASVTVTPQRGQIVHISLDPADTSRWPVILPAASGHYLLAFDDSRVVAGATRETGAGFDVRVTPGGLHEVLTQALAVAPGLAAGTHLETRVGLRPAAARPLLGPVPGMAGLVVATGLGATGLTMGPLAGTIAAQVALGLRTNLDLAPFSPIGS